MCAQNGVMVLFHGEQTRDMDLKNIGEHSLARRLFMSRLDEYLDVSFAQIGKFTSRLLVPLTRKMLGPCGKRLRAVPYHITTKRVD